MPFFAQALLILSVQSCRLFAFQRPPQLAAPPHLGSGFDPGCGRGQGSAARQQLPRFPFARSRGAALHAHASLQERDNASAANGRSRLDVNGNVKPTKLLVIKGLPTSIDEEYLKAIFKTYGNVTWTRMTAAPGDNRTSSGFVLFASEQAAAAALAEMNGAEVCGTDHCTYITVDHSNSSNSGSEMASQRLLSRLRAVKREVRLHQRIESEASATLVRPAPPLLPGDRGPLQSGMSSPLAAQGRALPDLDSDLNDKLTDFLNGLRLLLPQSAPEAHASLSNVSSLALPPSPIFEPPVPAWLRRKSLSARGSGHGSHNRHKF